MTGKKAAVKSDNITADVKALIKQGIDAGMQEMKADGWINVMAGLGGNLDKRKSTRHNDSSEEILLADELDSIYRADGLGAVIVDAVADDMTREWIKLDREDTNDMSDDDKDIKEVMSVLTDLHAEMEFNQALKWKRLFGGAVMIIGARDGKTLEEPLNINSIKTIDNILTLDCECVDIASSTFGEDPENSNFGKPEKLHVTYSQGSANIDFYVHASRCIFFYGKPIAKSSLKTVDYKQRFWGMSALQPCYNSLRDLGGALDSVSNILLEFVVGKFKIKGLANMLAAGNEKKLIQRMNIIQMSKSVIRAVILGEDEEWTRDTANLGGVSEVIQLYMSRLSGVSKIPQTKLFGRSAAGMNATGEGDQTQYYDMVKAAQRNELRPQLTQLLDIIRAWKKIKVPLSVEFNPLFQLTEKEEAEVEKIKADTDKARADMYHIYLEDGIITAEQIYKEEWEEVMGPYEESEPEPEPTPPPVPEVK